MAKCEADSKPTLKLECSIAAGSFLHNLYYWFSSHWSGVNVSSQ